MRQIYVLDTVRGARRLYNDAVRWHHMATEKAKKRLLIISFWERHGMGATVDAFAVSRRTLYRWKANLKKARGHVDGLNERSTAPVSRRKRVYPPGFLEKVVELRRVHDRTGKKKLATLLHVSESYAGRALFDLRKRGLLPDNTRLSLHARTGLLTPLRYKKRPRIRRKIKRGVEVDTIIRFVDGIKRYVYTAIDVEKKFALTSRRSSPSPPATRTTAHDPRRTSSQSSALSLRSTSPRCRPTTEASSPLSSRTHARRSASRTSIRTPVLPR